jgi:hypothetical protein
MSRPPTGRTIAAVDDPVLGEVIDQRSRACGQVI